MRGSDRGSTELAINVEACFSPLRDASGLLLAVSGGPDSVALMHLVARWRSGASPPVWVATVDHGLQPGSDVVAADVVRAAERLNLPGVVLPWTGVKPTSGLQAGARAARYGLLVRCAEELGASHVVTAHTSDDQAETILTRLAAGSGLSGLAGMRGLTRIGRVLLARPFLDIDKASLLGLCRESGWPFVEDAANRDSRFIRTRWRRLASVLAAQGLTPRRLVRLAGRIARAEQALSERAATVAGQCGLAAPSGYRAYRAAALLAEPDEIVLRVLASALTELGPPTPLRLHRLERLLSAVRESAGTSSTLRRTLHGCLVEVSAEALTVRPEPPRRTRDHDPTFQPR